MHSFAVNVAVAADVGAVVAVGALIRLDVTMRVHGPVADRLFQKTCHSFTAFIHGVAWRVAMCWHNVYRRGLKFAVYIRRAYISKLLQVTHRMCSLNCALAFVTYTQ